MTAPVISSTVSPRTRSAISSAPICEGVASPDIMASKAEAASSRDSVAPVATLPMIDLEIDPSRAFRSSATSRRVTAFSYVVAPVACAKRSLVDRGADVGFELGDVLRELLVGQPALQSCPSVS